jgi:hypothetical protein
LPGGGVQVSVKNLCSLAIRKVEDSHQQKSLRRMAGPMAPSSRQPRHCDHIGISNKKVCEMVAVGKSVVIEKQKRCLHRRRPTTTGYEAPAEPQFV